MTNEQAPQKILQRGLDTEKKDKYEVTGMTKLHQKSSKSMEIMKISNSTERTKLRGIGTYLSMTLGPVRWLSR